MANTTEQQLAIDTIDENVSVSAGAGSGKTAVLKQRFLNILLASRKKLEKAKGIMNPLTPQYDISNYDGVKSSNIVGITFTRKAAGEIKTRIREAMLDAMNEDNTSFWRMQLDDLERAQINTIHGLCARILKENPVEAGLDPDFVVTEEGDYKAFKEECLHDFLRTSLANPEPNSVRDLAELIGTYYLDNGLRTLLGNLEDIASETDLEKPYNDNIASLDDKVEALKACLQFMVDKRDVLAVTSKGAHSANYKNLENLGSNLPEIFTELDQRPGNLSAFDEAINFTARGEVKPEKDKAFELADSIKEVSIDIQALPLLKLWQETLKALGAFYLDAKKKANLLTFDDLEDLAIKVLLEHPDICKKYQKKFQYLMVDEFQDTNDKQRELIYLLCGGDKDKLQGKHLFIVGDPKQSIYRFRGAEVDVFKRVQDDIKASGGKNIVMKTNFRSRDRILNICNETFSKIMGTCEDQAVYFEALECCDSKKGYTILPELTKVETERNRFSPLEYQAVAQRIKELIEKEKNSEDYYEGKPVYNKIAILLRAMTHVNDLAKALAACNIPYVVIKGNGFYEQQETIDLLNIFDIASNPYQNIKLAAVLKSPYFGLDDESMTRIFLEGKYAWDVLKALDDEFLKKFREEQRPLIKMAKDKLEALQRVIGCLDLASLWERVWTELEIDAVLSLQADGAQKLANAKKLRSLAIEYSLKNFVGLGEWLDNLRTARNLELGETNANLDAVDAVQLMTIHQSKGLEFSKVILPFLGSKPVNDTRSIVYDSQIGLGLQIADERGKNSKSSVFSKIKAKEKEKEQEERQRLLYVAMTRAEDELYMFGQLNKSFDSSKSEIDESNWMQQLSTICGNFKDGCITKTFAEEDVEDSQGFLSEKDYVPCAEVIEKLAPLSNFSSSGRKLFTPSALNAYLYCQRQYFYSQVMNLPGLDESEAIGTSDMDAATMGTIIHEALENYNGRDNLKSAFRSALKNWAPCSKGERAWNILTAYVNSDLYKSIPPKQLREHEFLVPAADDSLIFNGIMDVLAENSDGTLTIIDYKTGKPHTDEKEILGYTYQLAIYKYAAEKIFSKKVSSASLHFLQDRSEWKLTRDDAYAEAVALCKEVAAKSREEEFTCNLESCGHCQYNYLCKQK